MLIHEIVLPILVSPQYCPMNSVHPNLLDNRQGKEVEECLDRDAYMIFVNFSPLEKILGQFCSTPNVQLFHQNAKLFYRPQLMLFPMDIVRCIRDKYQVYREGKKDQLKMSSFD